MGIITTFLTIADFLLYHLLTIVDRVIILIVDLDHQSKLDYCQLLLDVLKE